MERGTTIRVTEETKNRLAVRKYEIGANSYEEAIDELLDATDQSANE